SPMKPVGKPDALNGHVRFDERGWETGRATSAGSRAHPRLYRLSVGIVSAPQGGYLSAPSSSTTLASFLKRAPRRQP
ncbi:MAG: hypothetical protein WBW33_01550, partial [Bryobacteraceae bacterium]